MVDAVGWWPLLKAMAEGKQLQRKDSDGWIDDYPMNCTTNPSYWRVKPEPVRRPWTHDEAIAEIINGTVVDVLGRVGQMSVTVQGRVTVSSGCYSLVDMLDNGKVLRPDGTTGICGVEE